MGCVRFNFIVDADQNAYIRRKLTGRIIGFDGDPLLRASIQAPWQFVIKDNSPGRQARCGRRRSHFEMMIHAREGATHVTHYTR